MFQTIENWYDLFKLNSKKANLTKMMSNFYTSKANKKIKKFITKTQINKNYIVENLISHPTVNSKHKILEMLLSDDVDRIFLQNLLEVVIQNRTLFLKDKNFTINLLKLILIQNQNMLTKPHFDEKDVFVENYEKIINSIFNLELMIKIKREKSSTFFSIYKPLLNQMLPDDDKNALTKMLSTTSPDALVTLLKAQHCLHNFSNNKLKKHGFHNRICPETIYLNQPWKEDTEPKYLNSFLPILKIFFNIDCSQSDISCKNLMTFVSNALSEIDFMKFIKKLVKKIDFLSPTSINETEEMINNKIKKLAYNKKDNSFYIASLIKKRESFEGFKRNKLISTFKEKSSYSNCETFQSEDFITTSEPCLKANSSKILKMHLEENNKNSKLETSKGSLARDNILYKGKNGRFIRSSSL